MDKRISVRNNKVKCFVENEILMLFHNSGILFGNRQKVLGKKVSGNEVLKFHTKKVLLKKVLL